MLRADVFLKSNCSSYVFVSVDDDDVCDGVFGFPPCLASWYYCCFGC